MPRKDKAIPILLSLLIVFAMGAITYFQPPFFSHWIVKLESDTYDRQVRRYCEPLPPHPSIAIVAIDDRSISELGRWPWDRAKIAQITQELNRLGAKVIAFDILFSEPQQNPVDQILTQVKDPSLAEELEPLRQQVDSDEKLATALKEESSILGFAFSMQDKQEGLLPSPLFSLSKQDLEETLIPSMSGYIGNQPLFQQAAHYGGFINTMVDADGILRFSPLLMREKEKVYSCLALEAAQRFLSIPFSGIKASNTRGRQYIDSIELGSLSIPTDPWGRLLIPYRGPAFSFPYLSAVDVLRGKIKEEQVKGKLIFLGTSGTGTADFIATAISPVFPGVEVQATIASGIIDRYLPHKPNWGRGAALLIVLLLGMIAAFTFPYISRTLAFAASVIILALVEILNYWLWKSKGLVLSFFFPAPTLFTLFILDIITIYLIDRKRKSD